AAGEAAPPHVPAPEAPAYIIHTSGSTGVPKGVVVTHANLAAFAAAMSARIPHAEGDRLLAVTSIAFDIAVLELFWTLSRGMVVVLACEAQRTLPSGGRAPALAAPPPGAEGMAFSLFFWGNDDGPGRAKYRLLLEAAQFADAHGFAAVWTPERHFHAFGGPYPNPAVTGAAVAAATRRIGIRAGSCVAPLHHPARIAEDWAVIDNLSDGRAGLGIASGWMPEDFVLRPEAAPPANRAAMLAAIDALRRLWRGEAVDFPAPGGGMQSVRTLPRPVSREVALWLTTAGNPATWTEAGRLGTHVLTHLLGQSLDEVAEKAALYRAARREGGHDPAAGEVALMLHTYLDAADRARAREVARAPMIAYLRSAAGLIRNYAWAFPAFKRPPGAAAPADIDLGTLTGEELDGILDFAFERYFERSGLFGTVSDALERVAEARAAGVAEIACLIDYGIAPDTVLAGLRPLAEVVARAAAPAPVAAGGDGSIAGLIARHRVTHLQATPTLWRLLVEDEGARAALAGLRC
ncbi:MAG: LLM class flavin-dependent oxidoreductase, partial [Rhodobacteraceae bacterium]|nr:LLM class flavin-dependent oxidoreductase [Paracoccaceae bacterium]